MGRDTEDGIVIKDKYIDDTTDTTITTNNDDDNNNKNNYARLM